MAAIMPPMKVAPKKKKRSAEWLGAVPGNKIRTKRILNIDLHERTADGQTKKHQEAVYRKGLLDII